MAEIMELIGKVVELGTADMIYIGRLIEVGEEDVNLESESGWIVIPLEKVAYIRRHDGD